MYPNSQDQPNYQERLARLEEEFTTMREELARLKEESSEGESPEMILTPEEVEAGWVVWDHSSKYPKGINGTSYVEVKFRDDTTGECQASTYRWDVYDIIAYRAAEKPFEPITLKITCNTLEEAQHMWHRLNIDGEAVAVESSHFHVIPESLVEPVGVRLAWN